MEGAEVPQPIEAREGDSLSSAMASLTHVGISVASVNQQSLEWPSHTGRQGLTSAMSAHTKQTARFEPLKGKYCGSKATQKPCWWMEHRKEQQTFKDTQGLRKRTTQEGLLNNPADELCQNNKKMK